MLLFVNHKAYFNYEEIIKYETEISNLNITIFPSICYLPLFKNKKNILGAQDISEFNNKDRTGEIRGEQLKSLNVKYCLIGHRDRRVYKKENKKTLLNKVQNCLDNDIIPMFCINENVNKKELDKVLKICKEKDIILIYEPYKNIGNANPDLNSIEYNIKNIKDYVLKKYNIEIKIIYGGGVNINNIDNIKKIKYLDGVIIASLSLDINELNIIYNKLQI